MASRLLICALLCMCECVPVCACVCLGAEFCAAHSGPQLVVHCVKCICQLRVAFKHLSNDLLFAFYFWAHLRRFPGRSRGWSYVHIVRCLKRRSCGTRNGLRAQQSIIRPGTGQSAGIFLALQKFCMLGHLKRFTFVSLAFLARVRCILRRLFILPRQHRPAHLLPDQQRLRLRRLFRSNDWRAGQSDKYNTAG